MSRQRNEDERRREVEGWRRSGQAAGRYAASRGYSASSLLKWAAATRREESQGSAFVRLEVVPELTTELVVEVGRARVRVGRGFDPVVLRQVVAALGEGA